MTANRVINDDEKHARTCMDHRDPFRNMKVDSLNPRGAYKVENITTK